MSNKDIDDRRRREVISVRNNTAASTTTKILFPITLFGGIMFCSYTHQNPYKSIPCLVGVTSGILALLNKTFEDNISAQNTSWEYNRRS